MIDEYEIELAVASDAELRKIFEREAAAGHADKAMQAMNEMVKRGLV